MKLLETKFIITIAAALAYLAVMISVPFRRRGVKESAGTLLMPLASSSAKIFGLYILCGAVIAVIPLRNFAPYIHVILACVAVIGTEIAARETRIFRIAGLYENCILWGIYVIRYEQIYSLPTIAYENNDETVGVDFTYLDVILDNNKEIQMFFSDRQQRDEALKIILQKRPDLKS